MSRRCTIVLNTHLARLRDIEQAARRVIDSQWTDGFGAAVDELARVLGPRKE